jgi:Lrp/AsnC family transcriptional regulator of ectoine degradation
MKAIERSGLIRRYIAHYDLSRISRPITIFVEIIRQDHREGEMQRVISAIRKRADVTECFVVAGHGDIGVEKPPGHIVLQNCKPFSGDKLETLLDPET